MTFVSNIQVFCDQLYSLTLTIVVVEERPDVQRVRIMQRFEDYEELLLITTFCSNPGPATANACGSV
jgi:hypothetical protein